MMMTGIGMPISHNNIPLPIVPSFSRGHQLADLA